MEKIFKKVEIVQMVKLEYEVIDEKAPMPRREITEFQTLDGKLIKKIDPLETYEAFLKPYKYEK